MVSSINSIRIWSQQAALTAFKQASQDNPSSQSSSNASSVSSLADILYSSSNDDRDDDTDLSAMITLLQQQLLTGDATEADGDDGAVDDISSTAFMKALREKLEGLEGSSDTSSMAAKMLEALKAGTLTVTDAVAGEKIVARHLSDDDADKTAKASSLQSDWSSFLRDHLTRDSSGRFLRNADYSHQDKTPGTSSYFGMIGDTYYYLSWTAAPAKKAS